MKMQVLIGNQNNVKWLKLNSRETKKGGSPGGLDLLLPAESLFSSPERNGGVVGGRLTPRNVCFQTFQQRRISILDF